ncbi:MAG TPA: hypothetical protein VM240_06310 [Verrucomicrobiae bacterium]|nr:hypothetical protein [Verrucomicrobiae bacterium]
MAEAFIQGRALRANPFFQEWLLVERASWPRKKARGLFIALALLVLGFLWRLADIADVRSFVPLCTVLSFSLLFVETAQYSGRLITTSKNGWLANVPFATDKAAAALWTRLLVRAAGRVAITWTFFIVVLPTLHVGTRGLSSMAAGITLAVVGSLAGRWAAPVASQGDIGVLRVSRLTSRRPGSIRVWQATVALTAWRTPKSAWWCAALLLTIPNGMSVPTTLLACLGAFIVGATAAAWSLSLRVLPRALTLVRVARAREVLREGWAVPISAMLLGVVLTACIAGLVGAPISSAVVAVIGLALWASTGALKELWEAAR